jgi:hypothetical protein
MDRAIKLLAFWAFLLLALPLLGQNTKSLPLPYEDPLNKPQVWEKIIKQPFNRMAWQEYVGQSWVNLTPQKRVEVKLWQQTAMLLFLKNRNQSQQQVAQKDNQTNPTQTTAQNTAQAANPYALTAQHQELLKKPEIRAYVKQMEDFVLQEPMEADELKENLFENFFLIEDYFADEFKRYGEKYKYYQEAHPKGDYSEDQWIEEQEKKLLSIKKSYIEKQRYTFLEAQLKK